MTEENLRKMHRRQAIKIERRIERRKEMDRRKKENNNMWRSLKLMECIPAGQSTPAAHDPME